MGTDYYEHEVEVQYTEGILSKSRDWQWFLDKTEEAFVAPEWRDGGFDGFQKAFSEISTVYRHFSSIADIWTDLTLSSSCEWICRLWKASLIHAGRLELPDKPTGNAFFDLLDVVSYSTRLLNALSGGKLVYDLGLYSLGNYQDLYELENLEIEGSKIVSRLGEIDKAGLEATIATVKNNFEGKSVDCNERMIERVLDDVFDADFLSFKAPDNIACTTWQEAIFFDCLKASYQGDKLIPLVGYRGGESIPDFTLMTSERLANMRSHIADTRAHCVIDSIGYLLHGTKIPQESIDLLVDLALGRIEAVSSSTREPFELRCTAVALCAKMIAEDNLPSVSKPKLLGRISQIADNIKDLEILADLSRLGFPLGQKPKGLLADARKQKCLLIGSINDPEALRHYMEDEDVSRFCTQACAQQVLEKFMALVQEDQRDVPSLLISAMNFFIRLLNNKSIDNRWAKYCLIRIQALWSETLYTHSISEMKAFTHEFTIPSEAVNGLNSEVLRNPLLFGQQAFPLNEAAIENRIEAMVQAPLTMLSQKIVVDEFIPHKAQLEPGSDGDKHSVDAMIVAEVARINTKYSYRHINHFEAQDIAAQLCEMARADAYLLASMIHVIPEMYDSIRKRVSGSYDLITCPARGESPTLAHVCQLFPIMENTIRELGRHFYITPFRASVDEFYMFRDAPQIIGDLINLVFDETNTIAGTDDLTFVYFAMFSKNGLNIRNACVHGQGYQRGAQLEMAFKLTVICEYMLLYRLDMVIRAEREASDQQETDDSDISAQQG